MNSINSLKKINIKAEVLLLEWIDRTEKVQLEDVSLIPDGGFNHMVRREIKEAHLFDEPAADDRLRVLVARRSIYDGLPEHTMHPLGNTGQNSSAENRNKILKEHRDAEKSARQFFRPFDQCINRYRLKLEREERKVLTGFPVTSSHTLFDILWGQFDVEMTSYQKSILFSILPMAHEIAGQIDKTRMVYEAMIGHQVRIDSNYKETAQYCDEAETLGGMALSDGMVLGSASEESQLNYHVTVENIPAYEAFDFLPSGKNKNLMQLLADYFIPVDISVTFDQEVQSSILELPPANAMVGEEENGLNRLGYSIHL